MKKVKIIKFLNGIGLFNVGRSICYWLESFNPRLIGFYGLFIQRGNLCFDIGANIGRKIDIYLRLGARVVALEPHPECAQFLRRKYRWNKNVTIIQKALDAKEGTNDLRMCETNSLSTLSGTWSEACKKSGRYKDFHWDQKIHVETITLDQLIEQYGIPDYCKIDVEGHELNVLKGLTKNVPKLSFEISEETIQSAIACIRYLDSAGKIVFNFAHGDIPQFYYPEWLRADIMIQKIEEMPEDQMYGDIYAESINKPPKEEE